MSRCSSQEVNLMRNPPVGDSGSPNFIKSEDKYYALGVTSHGTKDNSNPTWPVMYAKVLYFKNWIKKHVTDLPKP
ncbi:hypothetical protein TNCV_2421271 [Trichonephila clavipes]|nr:hypothetical protein TNCV_2421271 [Trichonephila clavipes]